MANHTGYIFIARDGRYITQTQHPLEYRVSPHLDCAHLFPSKELPIGGLSRLMDIYSWRMDDPEGIKEFAKRYFTAVPALSIQSVEIGEHATHES